MKALPKNDHLSRFIERLYEIKESHNNKVTQADLKSMALEMGLSDLDWIRMQDLFSSHLARAIGYHKYKNWEDAIYELDQALSINPFNVKCLFLTASCYANKYYEDEKKADREQSINFANKALEINPLDEKSLQLLSSLKKEARQRKIIERESIKTLLVACSFGAVIFTSLAYLTLFDMVPTVSVPYTSEVTQNYSKVNPDVQYFSQNNKNGHFFHLTSNVIKIFEKKTALELHGKIMFDKKTNSIVNINWKDTDDNVIHNKAVTSDHLIDIKDLNGKFKITEIIDSEIARDISKIEIVMD
ncbi:hypothetical protein MY04_1233 [Flammeovirga sp. MY04]|uniref:hypothetical protein n=1 Tax=Flammeovirga sp. MY04 TaxID=1191459 RepID=UPI000824C06F|nr:hypothetical protein [Flammeovirga sp. MY04]ANQ48610.2 hypothetical protein MY04_1233 [Flammeovirga sp. MY04]